MMFSVVAALLLGAESSTCFLLQRRTSTQPYPLARCARLAPAVLMTGDVEMWRLERARLEQQYRRELLRRPRRYLPFVEARKWARAMWFTTREDWQGMISRGEKRNPYLPRYPDQYYQDKGWVSWEDFLNDPPSS